MSIILSNIIMVGLLNYLGMSFLEQKKISLVTKYSVFILLILAISLLNYNGPSTFGAILIILIFILYIFTFYKGFVLKKILVIFLLFIIVSVCEIFTVYLFSKLSILPIKVDGNSIVHFFAILLSNIFSILISVYFVKLSKLLDMNDLPKYSWLIFILPITTTILLLNVENYYNLAQNNKVLIIIIVGLFLSNLIFIYIFFKSINLIKSNKDLEISKYKENVMKIEYELVNQHYVSNFNFLHDLLHSYQILNENFEKKDFVSLKENLQEMSNTTFKKFNSIYTNLPLLNVIISSRLDDLKSNNINIKSNIEYNDFNFIELSDQTILFSTLIDLGIEANKYSQTNSKYIIIKAQKIMENLIIQTMFSNYIAKHKENQYFLEKLLKNYSTKITIKKSTSTVSTSIVIMFQIED